jgi:hypothetical protein
MLREESPEMQAAMLQAAALLLATGKYTTEDAANAVRCLRAVLRCAPLEGRASDVAF